MPDYNQVRHNGGSQIKSSAHIEGDRNITEGQIVSPRAV